VNCSEPDVRAPHRKARAGFFRVISGLALAIPAFGQEKSPHPLPHRALTVLEQHCVNCHGGEKTKGGLDLTTRAALLQGGETGPAITPGKPDTSLLYQMVAHLEEPGMPHKKEKLPDDAIEQIAAWIREGAPYVGELKAATEAAKSKPGFAITDADRAHWAFQPVRRVAEPPVRNAEWARTPIDRFILAAQEAKGLQPSPPASKETLIRRVTLDLIGLPPTPAEIDAFVQDSSANAYEKLVDRLLASPHYGERWGRHWLDLARFAESDGFEHDAVRAHAWRYRDYVVRAFNADKPYDRFIREQIAGDELYPDEPDALIATAFNLLGPDMVDSADQIQRRRNTLNDMTDTTALAFLGLTMGCARCHDHKFEPIAQRD
jgi:mono/diheme cytochrome c family protein